MICAKIVLLSCIENNANQSATENTLKYNIRPLKLLLHHTSNGINLNAFKSHCNIYFNILDSYDEN